MKNLKTISSNWYKISYEDYKNGNLNKLDEYKFLINDKILENNKNILKRDLIRKKIEDTENIIKNNNINDNINEQYNQNKKKLKLVKFSSLNNNNKNTNIKPILNNNNNNSFNKINKKIELPIIKTRPFTSKSSKKKNFIFTPEKRNLNKKLFKFKTINTRTKNKIPNNKRKNTVKSKSTNNETLDNEIVINERCVYCLNNVKNPVKLICEHFICYDCIKEINDFINKEEKEKFTCFFCGEKINLINYSNNINLRITKNEKENYSELNIKTQLNFFNDNKESTNQKCDFCDNSNAQFECLNCDKILCLSCKEKHLFENKEHKVRFLNNTIINTFECKYHNKNLYEYYCTNCNELICIECFDKFHIEHNVKKITDLIKNYEKKNENEILKGKFYIEKIEDLIKNYQRKINEIDDDKKYFNKKNEKNFKDIINIINVQKSIISNQINDFFDTKKNDLNKEKNQLMIIKNRFYYFKNFIYFNPNILIKNTEKIKNELNNLQLLKNITFFTEKILKTFNFDFYSKIYNLTYKTFSTFLNNPLKKIEYLLNNFKFLPLNQNCCKNLKTLFEKSYIISNELINLNLLLTLPKIISGKLLYRLSEYGPSPQIFHELCNEKGATLTLVKCSNGHIFGGFNEIEYKNKFEYNESNNNFLFSVTDGKLRIPIRCPIKKSMKKYAIKQSENDYSPSFGLSNNSDLFLAFKNLKNSYSNLNTCYKCPKGYNPKTFLAGKENDWNIQDVEVYSIKYLNDENFYILTDF